MSNEKLYDVAVIGGGLAGLCLAIQCAGKGLSVVLFEKEQYPFHKVCGEYISMESWDFLKRMGVHLDDLGLPLIKKLSLSDSKGRQYSFDLPLGGFGISRFALDDMLFKIAVARGVEVNVNTKVNAVDFGENLFAITTVKDTFMARVATAAFGKRSNLDIKWNRSFVRQKNKSLDNYIGVKYHIRYPHDPAQIVLHNFSNGYCGMSKIEEDRSCLCYLTTAVNLQNCGNSIDRLQKEILGKNHRLKEIFTTAEFLYAQPLTISQVSFSKKTQVENHVLMLGDSAGIITPLCGNGMSMAMHASKLACNAIEKFISNKGGREVMENNYCVEWKRNFSKRLLFGRKVQSIFGGDTSTSMFLKAMNIMPQLANKIIQATHGQPF